MFPPTVTVLPPTNQVAAASSCVPLNGVRSLIGAGVLKVIVGVAGLSVSSFMETTEAASRKSVLSPPAVSRPTNSMVCGPAATVNGDVEYVR